MADLKMFERKIVEKWSSPSEPWKFGNASVSPKAEWIRGYLLEHGEGYTQLMWTHWQGFVVVARANRVRIRMGSLEGFRLYMWILKRLGLITPSRKEGNPRLSYLKRQYYAINQKRVKDPAWNRPFQVAYPRSDYKLRKNP